MKIVGFSRLWLIKIFKSGLDFEINFVVILIIRKEYIDVMEIDKIIKREIKIVILDEIIFSIIESFEKNPDINGIPINDKFEIPNILRVAGYNLNIDPIWRISWYEKLWIKIPAHKNIIDLNKAWEIKWKYAELIEFREIANIIIAICLNVDNAIIFFMSFSHIAANLA